MTDLLAQLRALDEGVLIALVVVAVSLVAAFMTRNGWLGPAVIVVAFFLPFTSGSMLHATDSLWFTLQARWTAAGASSVSGVPVGPVGSCEEDAILRTIRTRESGGNYRAQAKGATASGAYQFIDATWASLGGSGHAKDAPPAEQDARALQHVRDILAMTGGDVSKVPVVWYVGDPSPDMDSVPWPHVGNTLTPREYQRAWLKTYSAEVAHCTGGAG